MGKLIFATMLFFGISAVADQPVIGEKISQSGTCHYTYATEYNHSNGDTEIAVDQSKTTFQREIEVMSETTIKANTTGETFDSEGNKSVEYTAERLTEKEMFEGGFREYSDITATSTRVDGVHYGETDSPTKTETYRTVSEYSTAMDGTKVLQQVWRDGQKVVMPEEQSFEMTAENGKLLYSVSYVTESQLFPVMPGFSMKSLWSKSVCLTQTLD